MLLFQREANVVRVLVLQNGPLLRKGSASRILGVGSVQDLIIVVRELFLLVRKFGESLLEILIFALSLVLIFVPRDAPAPSQEARLVRYQITRYSRGN